MPIVVEDSNTISNTKAPENGSHEPDKTPHQGSDGTAANSAPQGGGTKDADDKALKEAALLATEKSQESAEKAAAKEKAEQKNMDLKGELATAAQERRALRAQRRCAAEAAAEAARAVEARLAVSALKLEQARLAETLISAKQFEEDEKARKAKAEARQAQVHIEAQRKREKAEKVREAERRRRDKEEAERRRRLGESASESGSDSERDSVSRRGKSALKSALKPSPSHSSSNSSRNSPRHAPRLSPRNTANGVPPFGVVRQVSFSLPESACSDEESDSSCTNGVAKPIRRPNMQRLQSLADLSADFSDSDEEEGATSRGVSVHTAGRSSVFSKPTLRPNVMRLPSMAELSPASDSEAEESEERDMEEQAMVSDDEMLCTHILDFSETFAAHLLHDAREGVRARLAEEDFAVKQREAVAAERDAREAADEARRVAEVRRCEEARVAKDAKRLAEMSQLMVRV